MARRPSLTRALAASLAASAFVVAAPGTAPSAAQVATTTSTVSTTTTSTNASTPTTPTTSTTAPAGPDVVVTPSTGLRDGEVVRVQVPQAPAGGPYLVHICGPGEAVERSCTFLGARDAGDGGFDGRFRARAMLADGSDCREIGCWLEVAMWKGPFEAGTLISFDRAARLAPPSTFTVTPNRGVRDGDALQVAGTGHNPGEQLTVARCVSGDDDWLCELHEGIAEVTTDGEGAFRTSLRFTAVPAGEGWPMWVSPPDACPAGACQAVVLVDAPRSLRHVVVLGTGDGSPGATPARPVGASPRFTG